LAMVRPALKLTVEGNQTTLNYEIVLKVVITNFWRVVDR